VFTAIRTTLSARVPDAQVVALDKPSAYSLDDGAFWDTICDRCDAFVYATAPSASTTHYGIHYSAGLERRGRPGVVVTYETLRADARNSVDGVGMPIRWIALPYPIAAASGEALARFAAAILEQLIEPLRPEEQLSGTRPAPAQERIACDGDYDTVQNWFHEQGWTDGLPISPPTPSAVQQMLRGSSLAPDALVADPWTRQPLSDADAVDRPVADALDTKANVTARTRTINMSASRPSRRRPVRLSSPWSASVGGSGVFGSSRSRPRISSRDATRTAGPRNAGM